MLRENCPECGKIAKLQSETEAFGYHIYYLQCGHVITEKLISAAVQSSKVVDSPATIDNETRLPEQPQKFIFPIFQHYVCEFCEKEFESLHDMSEQMFCTRECYELSLKRDKYYLAGRPYQRECVEFVEKSNFNCLIADDMGLGKTIEVLLSIRYNKVNLTPIIFVVKSSLKYQWAREIVKWLNETYERPENNTDWSKINPKDLPFIIADGKSVILPGFNYYICSMTTLFKYKEQFKALEPKLIVIDESHHFKADDTKRTKALTEIAKTIPHKICTSGTPILNRAAEYFTTLNLIAPLKFYNKSAFIRQWVEIDYQTHKTMGIKKYRREEFKRLTANFVIRRLKHEVLSDLPQFSRYLDWVEIDSPLFAENYEKTRKELDDYLNAAESIGFIEKYQHVLALLSRLRQIVGVAKVDYVAEKVLEFFDSNELNGNGRKLCIGVHHKIVAQSLAKKLSHFNPILMSGEDNPEQKDQKVEQFRTNNHNLMIASTLACGEGLNMQFCSDAILVERQWNRPKEVQFEGRFNRYGQKNPVSVWYTVVRNSIDEWLTQLVEEKAIYTGSAIKEDYSQSSQDEKELPSVDMMKLAGKVAQRRLL